jgi:Protein of unknown function (DUF4235)
VTKILFIPFSVIGGQLAGFVGKKAFERLWRVFDDQAAPDPKRRDVSWGKLAAALFLQGAIFSVVRGLFDRGSRELFRRATGRWPGAR